MSGALRHVCRCVVVLPAITVLAGCAHPDSGAPAQADVAKPSAQMVTCDRARASRIALDSLARVTPFASEVHTVEEDSAGIRIVTWPTPARVGETLDGTSVVRLDHTCRIVSLIQTDSA